LRRKERAEKGECLEFVEEAVKRRNFWGETLPFPCGHDYVIGLAVGFKGISLKNLPMIKHALREGLSGGVGSEIGSETERLIDRKMSLDVLEGSSASVLVSNHLSSSSVEHSIDATNDRVGALDLDKIDRLQQTGFGGELARIQTASGCGNYLTSTSMDGVSVEDNIEHLELDSSHVLFTKHSLLGCPLEGSDTRVLDFV